MIIDPFRVKRALALRLVDLRRRRPFDIANLDRRQPPRPDQPSYNDSFYFTASGSDGTDVVARLGFRGCGHSEVWLFLRLPGLGRLDLPLELSPTSDGSSAGGLSFSCFEAGRRWRLAFDGHLLVAGEPRRSTVDLSFTATTDLVRFDHDLAPDTFAEAMAREPWSPAWLRGLQAKHQVHYEQGGDVRGAIVVDGERREVDLRGIRDHSVGRRSWCDMHRHLWMYAALDDGRLFHVSRVRMEGLRHHLGGYIARGPGTPLVSIGEATPLEEIGEAGLPGEFSMTCTPLGGSPMRVTGVVEDHRRFVMDGGYGVDEGLARFTVDGVPGRGIAEFGYRL